MRARGVGLAPVVTPYGCVTVATVEIEALLHPEPHLPRREVETVGTPVPTSDRD